VPHLDGARFMAFLAKPEERSAEQQAVVDFSDALIAELRRRRDRDRPADVQLRHPVPAEGLLRPHRPGRRHLPLHRQRPGRPDHRQEGYIFAARRRLYAGTPKDSQTAYVRDFLGFIGITDVEFVYAEGLNMGDESKAPPSPPPTKLAELTA
jgi:FMN-dependent NADH-azoreductase